MSDEEDNESSAINISHSSKKSSVKSKSSSSSSSSSSLKKNAEKYTEKLNKRGVIYLSRVPPFMKPNKARNIFEEFGEVTRLYLAEEDSSIRNKRKSNGGNGSKQFVEGWIEYSDKKIAKSVAESLNNTIMGGNKGSFYHDDIWNIKYLKNFKWDFLTEKFAYERRVREQKLKASMLQSKRANAEFVDLIEQQKANKHVDERRKRKSTEINNNEGDNNNNNSKDDGNLKRKFRQVQSIANQHGEKEALVNKKLLREIFTKKD
jgi:ESF2/ABP1 family protein